VTGVDVRACIERCALCGCEWLVGMLRGREKGREVKHLRIRGSTRVIPSGTLATSLYAIDVELDLVVSGNSCRLDTSPRITFTTTSNSNSVYKERLIRPTCRFLCSGEMEGWPFRRGELVNRARSLNPGHFRSII
jgi:hypothetical protein